MGSLTSPKTARHHISPLTCRGFAYDTGYMLTPGQPSPGLSYPPASPHRSPTTPSGPTLPHETAPKGRNRVRMVSIRGFSVGAYQRVREYQPVVHRLRLSASPLVTTYPGRISLPQEPLVIRRSSFSLLMRYSCLHSHSHGLHSWITPLLHRPQDAPLPNNTCVSLPRFRRCA